jgi:type IV pilus assembly protein PilZ
MEEATIQSSQERRNWLRLDKVFPVLVESDQWGFVNCLARNISCGGIFIQTPEPLPLGCQIRVYFALPEADVGISATGQVKNHYYLNYLSESGPICVRGMGVRFTQFEDSGAERISRTIRIVRPVH